MEAKYHQGKVPTTELSKTITQNVSSVDNLITIMVVTNFGAISSKSQSFNEAKQGCNDVRITGNASQALPVATELR